MGCVGVSVGCTPARDADCSLEERGVVKDWDTLEKVLDHLENLEAQLSFKDSPVATPLPPPSPPHQNPRSYTSLN